jgi:hypothetical protein
VVRSKNQRFFGAHSSIARIGSFPKERNIFQIKQPSALSFRKRKESASCGKKRKTISRIKKGKGIGKT